MAAAKLIVAGLLASYGATWATASMHEMQEVWRKSGTLLWGQPRQHKFLAKGSQSRTSRLVPAGAPMLKLPPGIDTWHLPNWVLQSHLSELHGPPFCNTEARHSGMPPLTRRHMDVCKDEDYARFLSVSTVMRDDPFNITRQFHDAVFLGSGGPHALSQCRVARRHAGGYLQAFLRGLTPKQVAEAAETDEELRQKPNRNVRLILDTQYVNMPRCCHGSEISGLFLNAGELAAWTTQAVSTLRLNKAECGVSFVQVWPKEGRCSRSEKCPLVVQLAGNGTLVDKIGDPWLLVQSRCASCMEELNTVLVSPQLPQDLIGEDGSSMGTSNKAVGRRLIPFVTEMLEVHRELDRWRVYLVAQSRGVDTALRAVLSAPRLFHTAIFSGMFKMTDETLSMLRDEEVIHNVRKSKLKEVQFHLGDQDRCFPRDIFFGSFPTILSSLAPAEKLRVTVRLYTESKHSVWYAAWNSMHDVIWTGTRAAVQGVPQTCAGR